MILMIAAPQPVCNQERSDKTTTVSLDGGIQIISASFNQKEGSLFTAIDLMAGGGRILSVSGKWILILLSALKVERVPELEDIGAPGLS